MENKAALRRLRKAAGLAGAQLAKRAGIDMNNLYVLERGERQPSVRTLRRIAEVLAKELQRDIGDILEELTREASPDAD